MKFGRECLIKMTPKILSLVENVLQMLKEQVFFCFQLETDAWPRVEVPNLCPHYLMTFAADRGNVALKAVAVSAGRDPQVKPSMLRMKCHASRWLRGLPSPGQSFLWLIPHPLPCHSMHFSATSVPNVLQERSFLLPLPGMSVPGCDLGRDSHHLLQGDLPKRLAET